MWGTHKEAKPAIQEDTDSRQERADMTVHLAYDLTRMDSKILKLADCRNTHCIECTYQKGEVLMQQGDEVTAGSSVFLLKKGTVTIIVDGKEVATRTNTHIGEGAVCGSRRNASVIARDRVSCVRMDPYTFNGSSHARTLKNNQQQQQHLERKQPDEPAIVPAAPCFIPEIIEQVKAGVNHIDTINDFFNCEDTANIMHAQCLTCNVTIPKVIANVMGQFCSVQCERFYESLARNKQLEILPVTDPMLHPFYESRRISAIGTEDAAALATSAAAVQHADGLYSLAKMSI
jgi:hypothetical protein